MICYEPHSRQYNRDDITDMILYYITWRGVNIIISFLAFTILRHDMYATVHNYRESIEWINLLEWKYNMDIIYLFIIEF